ncbi:MAG: carbohydrate ABC transporter permease [Rhodothermia bacterium]|nr:MAG: carbohydrate ABC transporter permease [Rhodothermia bacterium]
MKKTLSYIALIVGMLVFAYPFVWMVLATFKPEMEIGELAPLPSEWGLESYRLVFETIPIVRSFLNSLIVVVAVTGSVLVFSSMAAYALAKLNWRGRETAFSIILFTMMVPFMVMLIPLYTLVVSLGWTDSLIGLIVPFMMNATAILILRQSFLTLPTDLLEAARIDGCNEWRILFTIVVPLSVPAIVTAGIIVFIGNWNEVLWPIIVIRQEEWMTMPQMVALFSVGGGAQSKLGPQLAAAVMLGVPIIAAYLFFQRYFISSLASTGLKG